MANYDINYDDQRFSQVEADKESALSDLEQTYSGMIDQSEQYYQDLIDANKEWTDRQTQLQQEQTDFAIEKIEQQKAQAQKDYTKEQSGAYVDWQKQSNQYGANAEAMAAQGMAGTGYSESSQVSMYNTYQNRVATAREAYQNAVLNYNNSITEARLQNNSLLAEIAYNALQQQLELSLQGFQYKNQLILDKTAKKLEIDQMYYNRYQDVLAQINHENALAEQIRQYNESMAFDREKLAEDQRQFDLSLAEDQRQFDSRQSSGGGSPQYLIDKDNPSGDIYLTGTLANNNTTAKSIAKLGYGQLTQTELAQLIADGKVEEYVEDGIVLYRKTSSSSGGGAKRTNLTK